MSLIAYFDESGIHDVAPVCVLAGYVGSSRHWKTFNETWSGTLVRHGLTDFHAVEFFRGTRTGIYADWDEKRRFDFMNDLVSAIGARALSPIGAAIDNKDFLSLTKGERRMLTGGARTMTRWKSSGSPNRPYFLAFLVCLIEALEKVKPGKTLDFMFDDSRQHKNLAHDLFEDLRLALDPNMSARMGQIGFRSCKEAVPIQAADLLAHCWYRHKRQDEAVPSEIKWVLRRLVGRRKVFRRLDAGGLEALLSVVPADLRSVIQGDN